MVESDKVVEENAVANEHFKGLGDSFAGQACIVHFCQRGHGISHLALGLELAEPQAQELHGGHIGENGGKLVLDNLKAGEWLTKLDALLGISEGDFVSGDSVAY